MTPEQVIGLLAGLALGAGVGAVAALGLRGGQLERVQECRFECPRFRETVTCRISQDIRTGRWRQVESCSAFADPEKILCERECAKLLNLGFRLLPRHG
jgi:hypothetical protein